MPSGKPFNKQEIENYIRENAGKKTLEEMSKELGAAKSTIVCYCWRMGVSYELHAKKLQREIIKKAVLENHDKKPGCQIARDLNVAFRKVNEMAKSIGVDLIRVRKATNKVVYRKDVFDWRDYNNSII